MELEQINSEILELQQQLEKSHKDLENMVYFISHDLKEPLRMVSSYVQLIQKRNKGKIDKDTDDFISFAVEGVNKMKRQIEKIQCLHVLGSNHQHISRIDINEIIKRSFIELNKEYNLSKIKIDYGMLPELIANRLLMETLFYNIIEIMIIFNKDKDCQINISFAELNGTYLFSISDDKMKLPKVSVCKVLEMVKYHNNHDDSNLKYIEWAICRKIIEYHKGILWSELPDGKSFNVYFTIKCNN